SLLILLVALAAVSATMAFVCTPDICSRVHCAQVKAVECEAKGKHFHLIEHAGFCGCCSACAQELQEHESCLHPLVHGAPSAPYFCSEGLHCDAAKHVCVKNGH